MRNNWLGQRVESPHYWSEHITEIIDNLVKFTTLSMVNLNEHLPALDQKACSSDE
jgi:hypothetical protein